MTHARAESKRDDNRPADAAKRMHNGRLTAYLDLEVKIASVISGVFVEPLSEHRFNELALKVYGFQRENNEPYAAWCRARGPSEPTSWRDIPAVPQDAFKHSKLIAFPEEAVEVTFHTSGTTGETRGANHFYSTFLYETSVLAGCNYVVGFPEITQIILIPPAQNAPHSSLSHMMQALSFTAPAGAQNYCVTSAGALDFARIERLIAKAERRQRPIGILATALAFLNLFEEWERRGKRFALEPGSYAMETGGFKGSGRDISKEALYGQFARYLGLPADRVINEYGMTELCSQFYAFGLGNPHKGPPWTRALVIDPETGGEVEDGQTGVLRIFDLANLNSVLAIDTRDLAVRRGDWFELIGRDPAALPRGCSRAADEAMSR